MLYFYCEFIVWWQKRQCVSDLYFKYNVIILNFENKHDEWNYDTLLFINESHLEKPVFHSFIQYVIPNNLLDVMWLTKTNSNLHILINSLGV